MYSKGEVVEFWDRARGRRECDAASRTEGKECEPGWRSDVVERERTCDAKFVGQLVAIRRK